jgi:hypothetical protein
MKNKKTRPYNRDELRSRYHPDSAQTCGSHQRTIIRVPFNGGQAGKSLLRLRFSSASQR